MIWKLTGSIFLLVFYSIYVGKMLSQKKKGIQTDQIARGKKNKTVYRIELIMKIATYSVVIIEIFSIVFTTSLLPSIWRSIGVIFGILGNMVFAFAVWTMKDSWRAGIAKEDKTEMVTIGIYRYSRNPAFLGFNLLYAGFVLMFFNWILFAFSIFATVMFHLQILQEEKHLVQVFGDDYINYKKHTNRYIGRK